MPGGPPPCNPSGVYGMAKRRDMFVAAAARARLVCEPLAALIEGGSADRADLRLSAVEALALVDQALDGLPAAGGGGVEGGVVRRGAESLPAPMPRWRRWRRRGSSWPGSW